MYLDPCIVKSLLDLSWDASIGQMHGDNQIANPAFDIWAHLAGRLRSCGRGVGEHLDAHWGEPPELGQHLDRATPRSAVSALISSAGIRGEQGYVLLLQSVAVAAQEPPHNAFPMAMAQGGPEYNCVVCIQRSKITSARQIVGDPTGPQGVGDLAGGTTSRLLGSDTDNETGSNSGLPRDSLPASLVRLVDPSAKGP